MIRFPFTSLQQLNLDWIMQTLHKILDIIPMNGVAGDVLQRTVDGAAWQPLAAVSLDIHSMTAMTDAVAGNDELPIYDDSLQGNYKVTVSDLMLQAPVQSVNTQTGDVVLTAADVSALPDTTVIPTDTSDLTNTAGFVDAAGAAAAAPVQSVNGQTGAVTIPTSAVHSVNISGTTDSSGDFNLSSYITISDHVPIGFRKTSTFSFSAVLFGQTGSGTAWYMKILNDNAGNMSNQAFQGILYYLDV